MKFYETDLNDNVLDALDAMNFEDCTPIQEKAIPAILEGHDIIGVSQTGTGKTAAYLLPVLSRLSDGGFPENTMKCLIMVPTRELAQQIDQSLEGFSYYVDGLSSVAIYGGNDGIRYDQERKGLSMGVDIIIATPGRLKAHMNVEDIDFSHIAFFILDEADRMLDMGFSDDIMQIEKVLPKNRQTILFSATMPPKIKKLASQILHDPVSIELAVSRPAEKIIQTAYICHENQKLPLLTGLFKESDPQKVIVFSSSKQKVKDITRALKQKHLKVGEMHSDLEQQERDEVMYQFKSEQIDILVATDIVARGIDIDDVSVVINYDVPHDAEDYIHRIGRTARAGRGGCAITLVNEKDQKKFGLIERFLEKEINKLPVPAALGAAPAYKPFSGGEGRKGSSSRQNRNNPKRKKNKQSVSQKTGENSSAAGTSAPSKNKKKFFRRKTKKTDQTGNVEEKKQN